MRLQVGHLVAGQLEQEVLRKASSRNADCSRCVSVCTLAQLAVFDAEEVRGQE